MLGICNGFQVLCEAGLLPGALLPNDPLRFVCRQVELVVENDETPFTRECRTGQRLSIPVKHESGRYFAPAEQLDELEARGGVVLRYAAGQNPNGSAREIAARRQRARQRDGADASSRARRRPADRLGGRAADLRLPGRIDRRPRNSASSARS